MMSSTLRRCCAPIVFLPVLFAGCDEQLASDAPAAAAASDDAGASTGASSGGSTSGSGGGAPAPGPGSSDGGAVAAPDGGSPLPSGGDGGPRTAAPCKANGTFGSSALGALPSGPLTMYECDPTGMEGKASQPAPLVLALHGYTQGAYEAPQQGWTPGYRRPDDVGIHQHDPVGDARGDLPLLRRLPEHRQCDERRDARHDGALLPLVRELRPLRHPHRADDLRGEGERRRGRDRWT